MRYEQFLASRYAFTKRRENFITIISILSTLGITVGTAALIIVLSVFNGFSKVVTDLLVNFDPHVRISTKPLEDTDDPAARYLSSFDTFRRQLIELPEIAHAAPTVQGKAVLIHYTKPKVIVLTGLSVQGAREVTGLASAIQSGELRLDSNSIIVGQLLADELALILGDSVEIVSPVGLERILTEPIAPRTRKLVVRGIFAVNNREYDAINAYTGLDAADDLFDIPRGTATNIDLRLHNIRESQKVKRELTAVLPANLRVQTWYDLHNDLYQVMEIERWVAYIILILIVAVATFNIFSSLTLTVFEKQRDIGLLRALGASARGIRRIYILQGAFIGIIGTAAGCALGVLVVVLQQQFGFFKLDMSVYIIPALPVELRLTDFLSVAIGSVALATVGAYFPARRAARVLPAQALRYE